MKITRICFLTKKSFPWGARVKVVEKKKEKEKRESSGIYVDPKNAEPKTDQ